MAKRLLLLFCFQALLLSATALTRATLAVGDTPPQLNQKDANPCTQHTSTVKEFSSDIWLIHQNYSQCTNDELGFKVLRIGTNSANASVDNPVVFVTRMGRQVQTWHLPLKPNTFKQRYDASKHTICARPPDVSTSDSYGSGEDPSAVTMYMDVFTSNITGVSYSFVFELVENFELKLKKNSSDYVNFPVSATEPQLYYFKFPDGVSAVRVVANSSNGNNCAIISIQNASCPVNDQLDNARSKGVFQTMITSASLVITANETVQGREFFVVVVAADEDICTKKFSEKGPIDSIHLNENTTSIDLMVMTLQPASSYKVAIVLPLVIFLFIGITTLLVFLVPCCGCTLVPFMCSGCLELNLICFKKQDIGNYDSLFEVQESTDFNDDEGRQFVKHNTTYGSVQGSETGSASPSVEQSGSFRRMLVENETKLVISDLLRRGYSDLEKSYKVYGWNTITVGIFYALPAFQLVFSEQMILNSNGDQDICYYNFKCARPYSQLSAFNNIWSNIGYVIMGLSFLGIVAIRNYRANKEMRKNKQKFDNYGVPQFFGIYYAMGFGMVMEGFMSAFYHICPSDNNFQFDTAFMFIIGGLLVVKMLQARHPDIQANAFVAFFCFAVVIFLTFIGIWEWSKPYWHTRIALAFLAILGVVVFTVSYYFFHDWRVGHWIEVETYRKIFRWLRSWCVLCNTKEKSKNYLPKHPYRFVKMSLLVVSNVAAIVMMLALQKGIATVVLSLFILNYLVLMLLYVVCKFFYREPITLMPIVFLIILGACWGASFYFYFSNVSQWEVSPAQSRQYNKDCIVMDFYDNHDIWHFLSAAAMFFSFLFLFTLDDGTQVLERCKIHVF